MEHHYYYRLLEAQSVEGAVASIPEGELVRAVFFVPAADNEQWRDCAGRIRAALTQRYGDRMPLWSCIAQRPLGEHPIAVEAHYLGETGLQRRECDGLGYFITEGEGTKELFLSAGPHNCDLPVSVPLQAGELFAIIERVFAREQMPLDSIVRQWNYIEGITFATDNYQHYQALNDARSGFYGKANWKNGYPAATGIGAACGGITVEINAATGIASRPIDNKLQVAAWAYSGRVLDKGESAVPSTPKFERAREADLPGGPLLYISGTAAIRGEESLHGVGIDRQTRTTVENIEFLIGNSSLAGRKHEICNRVYVKNAADADTARRMVEEMMPGAGSIYIQADVCRPELLVEIESLIV